MQINAINHSTKSDNGKFLNYFKRWRVVLFVGLSAGFGVALAILFYNTKRSPVPPSTDSLPSITPSPSRPQTKQSYFLNTIGSDRPITGYSWAENQLVYSTPKGVYAADTNLKIVDRPISYITWSQNGKALYQSQNQWFWLTNISTQPKPILMELQSPMLSPSGQTAITVVDNSVTTISLSDLKTKSRQFDYAPTNLVWSPSSQIIAFEQKSKSVSSIVILSPKLDLISSVPMDESSQLLAISFDDSWIVVQNGNALQITSIVQNDKSVFIPVVNFTPSSKLSAVWMSDILVVIETYPDRIGRKINYIWKLNKNNSEFNKELLANSAAIPRKLNLVENLTPDPKRLVLPLVENQGELWFLSLVPNSLPSYSSSGIKLRPIIPSGD